MSKIRLSLLAAVAGLILLVIVAGFRVDGIRWRAAVLGQKIGGDLESISWAELVPMLKPGSPVYIGGLAETPNPFAVIRNPHTSSDDFEAGQRHFGARCMHCHGARGVGGTAPNIATEALVHGDSDWAVYRTITDGVEGTAMVGADLSDVESWQVTGYLMSIRQSSRPRERERSARLDGINLSHHDIELAASEPGNWLTYSGTYNGQRHSRLTGINRQSIERLTLRWVMQTDAIEKIEASPIVIDGAMFLSMPEGIVVALDGTTGERLWQHQSPIEGNLSVCCGRVNRGVAVLGDKVYATTLDNRLQALDAGTGKLVWESRIGDSRDGITVTVAPLAVRDKVIVGVSGGEYGIRGFLDAYDADSGERAWRFHTIPGPGMPGNDTWAGESWRTGGGPTWVTGSYDPALNLVYWGVGNPSPDFDGSGRLGDNLYTNSVVALDASTGELRWHYQFTPHDLHDYDANQIPVLVDSDRHPDRTMMYWANRNGFFYRLNRATGTFRGAIAFAKQNWAKEIDKNGRPLSLPTAVPSQKGVTVWPGASGATNWPPPSFNPATGLFYVARVNRPSVFFNVEAPEPRDPRNLWLGSASTIVADSAETSLVAIDPEEMSIIWSKQLPNIGGRGQFSGVMSTAESVFIAESEVLIAFDAVTGDELWRSRLGGPVGSPPVTYAVDGVQYVAVFAGRNLYSFGVTLEDR